MNCSDLALGNTVYAGAMDPVVFISEGMGDSAVAFAVIASPTGAKRWHKKRQIQSDAKSLLISLVHLQLFCIMASFTCLQCSILDRRFCV